MRDDSLPHTMFLLEVLQLNSYQIWCQDVNLCPLLFGGDSKFLAGRVKSRIFLVKYGILKVWSGCHNCDIVGSTEVIQLCFVKLASLLRGHFK